MEVVNMAKKMQSSTGYFSKEMLAILDKGEKKTAKKSTGTKKKATKKK